MRAACRYAIGSPFITVPASRRNTLYLTTPGDFPTISGPLVNYRVVELRVYESGTVAPGYEQITNAGPLVEVRISNPVTGEWELAGGGNASHWVVDWAGAFGPGFDELYDTSSGPFADPSLEWGPTYLLAELPWGGYQTYEAAEGDTIVCAAYWEAGGTPNVSLERIWTLTGGEWVFNDAQPSVGDLVLLADSTVFGDYALGNQFMLTGDGRMEATNLQLMRAIIAHTTAIRTVTTSGSDSTETGSPWGTVLVDSTDGAVTRTLPDEYFPGRVIQYVKVSSDSNPVVIEGGTNPLLTPAGNTTLYLAGETARFTFTGNYWYQIDGRWGSTTERVKEPHGIEDRSQSVIAFDDTSRTFTITPTGDQFVVWCSGIDYTFYTPQSTTVPDANGLYLLYFEDGELGWTSAYVDWPTQAPVAYVYWNADTNRAEFVADERHGITMDWQTHEYLHRTRGAVLASGFALYDYTTTGSGSAAAHATVAVQAGTFFDEDLQVDVVDDATPTSGTWEQVLSPAVEAPVFYRSGDGWTSDTATTFPLKQGSARAQYNYNTGSSWATQDANANRYVSSWLCATNIIDNPVIVILGQSVHSNLDAAKSVGWDDLDLSDLPVFEIRPLWHLVYQTGSYANTPHARLRAALDVRIVDTPAGVANVTDHGALLGLLNDDHPQYQRADVVVTATDPYTMEGEAYVVTTGAAVTLPSAASMLGRSVRIGAALQDVTVSTVGSDTILDTGASTDTVPYGTGGYYLAIDYFGFVGWSSLNLAGNTRIDTSAFSENLSATDNTLAAALATLDTLHPTPATHADSHENGGSDELSLDGSQITSGTVDTSRLSVGTATGTVAAGDDSRFTNSRTPTSHASTHGSAGSDPLTLAASDIPSLDANKITTGTMATARLGSGTANSTTFLRGDQTYAVPAGKTSLLGGQDEGATVSNTAVTTSLLDSTITVTGTSGDLFRVSGMVRYLNNSGAARVPQLSLKLGSTVVATSTSSIAASASSRYGQIEALVRVEANNDVNGSISWAMNAINPMTGNGVATEAIQSGVALDIVATITNNATHEIQLMFVTVVKVSA
jgi:hypothetical protein